MQTNPTSTDTLPLDPDDDALPEGESVLSRREVRISLGVIGALLIVLGVLVARRWSAEQHPVAQNDATGAKTPAADPAATKSSELATKEPANAEELPPVALRPVEGAEPPIDEPAFTPSGASADPFSHQVAASPPTDASQEVGQATLAPDETATDDGFPDAADTGIVGAEPPLDASTTTPAQPPSPTAIEPVATPAFPKEPEAGSSFGASEPPLEASAPPLDASPHDSLSEPPAFNSETAGSNPLRAAPPVESDVEDEIPPSDSMPRTEQSVFPPDAPVASEPQPDARVSQEPDSDLNEPAATHQVEPPPAAFGEPAPTTPNALGSAGSSTAPPNQLPATSTAEPYRTVTGDTFWSISKRAYGTGAYYQALAEFNRGIVPPGQSPAANQNLLIPTAHELEQRYPQLCPTVAEIRRPGGSAAIPVAPTDNATRAAPATMSPTAPATLTPQPGAAIPQAQVLPRGQRAYRVKSGETLYDIAEQQLGSPLRWTDIYKLNKQLLGDRPHDLRAGMDLVLPSPEDRSAANPRIRP